MREFGWTNLGFDKHHGGSDHYSVVLLFTIVFLDTVVKNFARLGKGNFHRETCGAGTINGNGERQKSNSVWI